MISMNCGDPEAGSGLASDTHIFHFVEITQHRWMLVGEIVLVASLGTGKPMRRVNGD